ncbi:MAG: tRNA pseudouridine(38-40) synthase TruA [Phycisphaerae bacterium]
MVRNIKLVVAYDGTDFHGWQSQPGLRTVQDLLEQAIRSVARHQVRIIGSGRTDAGVHARGQVANFVTTCTIPAGNFRRAIGSRIPKDMSLRELADVHPGFDARRSSLSKLYCYRVHAAQGRPVDALTQRQTYHFWHPLDIKRMRAAARHFVGTQDFQGFASKGGVRASYVRQVMRCEVERYYDEIRISVEGSGFLYNQVRNMVGTLLEIGRGHWEPDRVLEVLATRDRSLAGPTAPARGLSLEWVRYPAALLAPADPTDDGAPDAVTAGQ